MVVSKTTQAYLTRQRHERAMELLEAQNRETADYTWVRDSFEAAWAHVGGTEAEWLALNSNDADQHEQLLAALAANDATITAK
jgi:hypothetical protein